MREFIHIGFPKTASTTLQDQFFAKLNGVANTGRPFESRETIKLVTGLALDDDGDYDEKAMAARIEQARASGAEVLLHSDETVVNTSIRMIAAKRLHRLLPEAKIIAIVRNQFDALESYYAGHGRQLRPAPQPWGGRYVTFDNFIAFHVGNPRRGPLPTFDYAHNLETYASLFGEKNVHVLLYEDFVSDRTAFLRSLAEILGLNPDSAPDTDDLPRARNRIDTGSFRYQSLRSRLMWEVPISKFVPWHRHIKQLVIRLLGCGRQEVKWNEDLRAQVAAYYSPGNRTLVQNFGLSLSTHNYPL